jgi:arylsulfatase A-like enzyme
VDALRANGLLDRTLLIITSDHGENFGEHGLMGHQFSVHDTLLHVPLIVRYPPLFPGARVIDQPVQLVDLFPTILTAAGQSPPSAVAGTLLTAPRTGVPLIAQYFRPLTYTAQFERLGIATAHLDRRLAAVHQGDDAYIWASDGRDELYDTSRDPEQLTNLVSSANPTVVQSLRAIADASIAHAAGTGPAAKELDAATREALRNLGYLP